MAGRRRLCYRLGLLEQFDVGGMVVVAPGETALLLTEETIRMPRHVLADRFANPATVAALRRRHRFVAVWGVTDLERIEQLQRMGVAAVIADDLTMLATARAARGSTVPPPASPPAG